MSFLNLKILIKKFFSINNFDGHLTIYFLGLRIRKKLNLKVREVELIESGITDKKRETKIILSLTTFPQRINYVEKTIKTLLNQTLKPDEVVLYLADSQFPKKREELPKSLLKLENYGLTIKWCEDLRSFKKLIPALADFENDIIITFDDDVYYPNDIVENLYNSYLKNPDCIHTNRARRIEYKKDGEKGKIIAKSAAEIYWTRYKDCTFKNTLTGYGGVLYPPKSLYSDVSKKEIFQKILPTQDDVWFWAMAVMQGTKIKVVSSFDIQLITVKNTQQFGLSKINKKNKNENLNQTQGMTSLEGLNLIVEHYPEIIEKLTKEDEIV